MLQRTTLEQLLCCSSKLACLQLLALKWTRYDCLEKVISPTRVLEVLQKLESSKSERRQKAICVYSILLSLMYHNQYILKFEIAIPLSWIPMLRSSLIEVFHDSFRARLRYLPFHVVCRREFL